MILGLFYFLGSTQGQPRVRTGSTLNAPTIFFSWFVFFNTIEGLLGCTWAAPALHLG